MKSLAFIDVDGVFNSNSYFQAFPDAIDEKAIDPSALRLLDQLIEETGCQIVVSSTWRIRTSVSTLRKIFKKRGLKNHAAIIGKTPVKKNGAPRGSEIAAYLKTNGHQKVPFVILDDDDDMGPLTTNLVQTDPRYGIQPSDIRKAKKLLSPSKGSASRQRP